MSKYLFILLFLLQGYFYGQGQINLAPNPSFEILTSCPKVGFSGQIGLAVPWINALGYPDLLNSCAGSGSGTVGVPVNGTNNYQNPRTGNGYATITTYLTLPRTTSYMEVKLSEKLKRNKRYYIVFYVSPRDGADPCFSDAMGLSFSDTLYKADLIFGIEQIPPFTPAIQNPVGNILKDTMNWIEISGCYTAKGTEQYAIIGSFRTSKATKSEGCIGVTGSLHFVDDVSIYEFEPLPADTITLCKGESKKIGRSFLNGTYRWNTGAKDSVITVTEGGQYIYNITVGNCILSDTVTVIELDKVSGILPKDTLLCKGDTLQVSIPILGKYAWSNGLNVNSFPITKAGVYSVSITNECKTINHSFEVKTKPCECNVYIPNAFSPNNDGINDYLECFISNDYPYKCIRFQVYDRWGELIYTNSLDDLQSIKWDGTYKNRAVGTGAYAWYFEYEYTRNKTVYRKLISGDVNILR